MLWKKKDNWRLRRKWTDSYYNFISVFRCKLLWKLWLVKKMKQKFQQEFWVHKPLIYRISYEGDQTLKVKMLFPYLLFFSFLGFFQVFLFSPFWRLNCSFGIVLQNLGYEKILLKLIKLLNCLYACTFANFQSEGWKDRSWVMKNEKDCQLKFGHLALGPRKSLQMVSKWAANAYSKNFYDLYFCIYAVQSQFSSSCSWQFCSNGRLIKIRWYSSMRELWFHKQLYVSRETKL
jgi:hypothetical protein